MAKLKLFKITLAVVERISGQGNATTRQTKNKWVAVDEEVMLKEYQEPVITLSSDEEEVSDTENYTSERNHRNMSNKERVALIKQEIIEESIDLCASDFALIADVDDETINGATLNKLGDSLTIDMCFGDDTLLVDFKRDNDCKPSSSRFQDNPDNDIITCYICEDKLTRRDYGQHMNGCAGISKKILPRKKALKKLSAISKEARPRRQIRPSAQTTRDILRNAGYSDAELYRITSAVENEEEDLNSSADVTIESGFRNTTAVNGSPEVLNISSEDENTIRYRQRNLYKTTRECPICLEDVEEANMNMHLDICLLLKRSSGSS